MVLHPVGAPSIEKTALFSRSRPGKTRRKTIIAALLPAVLLLLYIWKIDPQKEPTVQLVKAVLWGAAICLPVSFVEWGLEVLLWGVDGQPTTLYDTTTIAFFIAALPEEAFKLLALWLVVRKNPYFDEHVDGIVYAVCVGLGFAAIENVFYLFSQEDWMTTAVTRSLLAVPGHYAFAVLMGYYYSLYHFVNPSLKNACYILLVPVIVHGGYDTLALSGTVSPKVGGMCFFILVFFCIKMHRRAIIRIEEQIKRDSGQV